MDHFDILDHTADIGLRLRASNLETLFVQAAAGLYAVGLDSDIPEEPGQPFAWHYRGESWEEVLVHYLNELIFRLFTQTRAARQLVCRPTDPFTLEVSARLVAVPARHLKAEIKSATYHQLRFARQASAWVVEVYFDV